MSCDRLSSWRGSSWLGAALLLTASGGCGDSHVPPEDPAVCVDAWQPLTPPRPFDVTSPLSYENGALYFMTATPEQLVALSTSNRRETTLAPVFGFDSWIEGDQFLYWVGNQVFTVPLSGGTARVLFDGGVGRPSSGTFAIRHAHTSTDLFWTEGDGLITPTDVWRAARPGAPPTKVGTVGAALPSSPAATFQTTMAVSNDSALLASLFGSAFAVPFDGGAPRPLARPDTARDVDIDFMGVDDDGVTWSIPRPGADPAEVNRKLVLAPADGSAVRDLWPALPARVQPLRSWTDGQGGRIVAAAEPFDDGNFHTSIWTLSADGVGARLACAPKSTTLVPRVENRPVVTSDDVYLIGVDDTWQVVRVPR